MMTENANKTLTVATIVGLAHIVCGIAAIYQPGTLVVTQLNGLSDMVAYLGYQSAVGGYILLFVGALAIYAMRTQFALKVTLLLPQQFLLCLQMWSISVVLATGVYPDGHIPLGGPWFILTDQIWAWLLTCSHSVFLAKYIYQGMRGNDGALS
jgi:hypothetical protein